MAGGGDEAGANLLQESVDMDVVADGCQDEDVLERVTLDYEPTYQRFVSKDKTFTQQYSHLYTQRLLQMRPILKEAAVAKWGADVKVCERMIDLEDGERVIIIGTVFKDMPLRPSVLDEYRDEATLQGALEPVANYVSSKDVLVLEDDSGRVTLAGEAMPIRLMCTGLVLAAVGMAKEGSFVVEEYCQAGMAPQTATDPQVEEGPASYVVLMSGLRIGEAKDLLPLQLLLDYVGGHLGSHAEQREVVSRIGRVIIAGDLLKPLDASALKEKHLSQKQQQGLTRPLRELDLLLSQLASAVPVDIMAGSDDPCNFNLPQQPLHTCLMPRAARYSTLRLVTNPYEARIGGRLFLGASGQIIDDMTKYTSLEDGGLCPPVSLLEDTLSWRHMAPTAPDTLPCHPFCHSDPFVMKHTPHVYFTANHDHFATSLAKGPEGQKCRVVVVPCFHATQEVVLLNLKTLEATPLRFRGLSGVEKEDEGSQ